ncbi:MAG: glutamine synthetase III [Prevotellaceae bacterium]|jgi:glutamine synthetase|nr:glutamine synthetase III [Prevotellaceae bacterium]
MSTLRFKLLDEAFGKKAVPVEYPSSKVSDYFGQNVFSYEKMKDYLSKTTFKTLSAAVKSGAPLTHDIADEVAQGMKQWAIEMGATHYTHWFQPLTGGTAEKHDAFAEFNSEKQIIEEFSGKLLVQQEPDASSFPSGGIRNTFEARGYTAWDPASPAFVVGDTLCIPTIFISYTGEALDYKAPLLKALSAVDKNAVKVCKFFDESVTKVFSYLGWEQEYFLVDGALWAGRPDLVLTGRTLMGHDSAKNQQLEDHYFGHIPSRVLAFMTELEVEAHKLGIPVKTRHNEVAPNQFELAPIYEETNLAVDHNLLVMSVMRRVARRHGFRVVLHEKPFKGVNGSGKHCNWSLGTDTGVNLLAPGKDAVSNLQFVTFVANVLKAVYKHNALLKASISSATNAHRLGANEAPPAIISVFLGSQISAVLDKVASSKTDDAIAIDKKAGLKLGVGQIPELFIDNTDRNRTSPFAFTGNRFEFRAVGSSENCGAAMTALNAAVAHQLGEFLTEVEALIAKGAAKEKAIFEVVKKYISESAPIRFDGNGYSDEWKAEAAKRGLDCETSVPIIFDSYLSESSVKMFAETDVFNKKELHSRCEVKWETYTKKIQIESRVLGDLALNHIVPVATEYQSRLLDNVAKVNTLFAEDLSKAMSAQNRLIIERIANHTNEITLGVANMINERKVANKIENEREKALAYHNNIVPRMDAIRYHIDKLELIVDNEMWPLPKYRELLFVR